VTSGINQDDFYELQAQIDEFLREADFVARFDLFKTFLVMIALGLTFSSICKEADCQVRRLRKFWPNCAVSQKSISSRLWDSWESVLTLLQ